MRYSINSVLRPSLCLVIVAQGACTPGPRVPLRAAFYNHVMTCPSAQNQTPEENAQFNYYVVEITRLDNRPNADEFVLQPVAVKVGTDPTGLSQFVTGNFTPIRAAAGAEMRLPTPQRFVVNRAEAGDPPRHRDRFSSTGVFLSPETPLVTPQVASVCPALPVVGPIGTPPEDP